MAHTWAQREGEWFEPGGRLLAKGYSGHDFGVNCPEADGIPSVGPIPRGAWTIGPLLTDEELRAHQLHGPVMRLLPRPETVTHGRSGFLIHGDLPAASRAASHGCIILPLQAREAIWDSGDRDLVVIEQAPVPASERAVA